MNLKFRIPDLLLSVFTLEVLSLAIKRPIINTIVDYSEEFRITLEKHLTTETEVQIVKGVITAQSDSQLCLLETEWGILQYRSRLTSILQTWKIRLCGQPITHTVEEQIDCQIQSVIEEFENFIITIQHEAQRVMRVNDNKLCKEVTTSEFKILNLTTKQIPRDLALYLSHGTNFVPHAPLTTPELGKLMEQDLIKAAISFFRDNNNYYPHVTEGLGLQTVLKQLMSQVPSNSKQLLFYTSMHDSFNDEKRCLYQKLHASFKQQNTSMDKMLPPGTMLSISDKGLGPCLLPLDWYILQYAVQSEKGNHIKTGLSSDQCINLLNRVIDTFRTSLNLKERETLKQYFKTPYPKYRVGVLKLVPKIHKLSSFDNNSWKILPSRPIRGAENCPINNYSKSLCKMLQ